MKTKTPETDPYPIHPSSFILHPSVTTSSHDYLVHSLRDWLTRSKGKPAVGGRNCGWRNDRRSGTPSPRTGICPRCWSGQTSDYSPKRGTGRAGTPNDAKSRRVHGSRTLDRLVPGRLARRGWHPRLWPLRASNLVERSEPPTRPMSPPSSGSSMVIAIGRVLASRRSFRSPTEAGKTPRQPRPAPSGCLPTRFL